MKTGSSIGCVSKGAKNCAGGHAMFVAVHCNLLFPIFPGISPPQIPLFRILAPIKEIMTAIKGIMACCFSAAPHAAGDVKKQFLMKYWPFSAGLKRKGGGRN
jgi:hypothetical protein